MTPAPAQGRLTEERYWDNVWLRKETTGWGDLGWIERSYGHVVLDRMLRARLPQGPRRFLEVGCGTGRWLIYFQKRFGYAVTGCDYSEVSCEMARRNLAGAGVEGSVVQGDLFALTGAYDVVFSTGLIEHFDEPGKVLAKFRSLLRPGGTLISLVPNLRGLSGLYHRWWKPETFNTHRPITLAELRGWYRELGLRQIDAGALGSVIPLRFPRDKIRREHPLLYRFLWTGFLQPVTWSTNRACLGAYRLAQLRPESERFSPNLYAVGDVG
jgi:2-polyprenyl-6-hydroxyphenyl methylase/3-demethylubiquinone-9 3-methyltransferase